MLFSERVTNVALVTQTVPTNWKIQKTVEIVLCNRVTDIPLASQTVPTNWKIQKTVEVVLCNRVTDIPLASQTVQTTKKIQKRLATTRPRASRSSSHRDERREGCRV